jgi:dolichol-phosphate mannosyltransferase
MAEKRKKLVVLIPTYNERENIKKLIREVLALPLELDLVILVVDDNSPDGTGDVARRLAGEERRLKVLIRLKRRGRGTAGIDGFKEALKLGADYTIEMDGDSSHQPRFIPLLLESAQTFDLVIGSRFVPGGRDAERSFARRFITLLVRNFIRFYFHLPVKDVSSGFRCFRRRVLEEVDLDDLISVGPSLVLEVLYKAFLAGFSIGEVPIVFVDRKKGKTKLTLLKLLQTLVTVMKFKRLYSRLEPSPDR